MRPFNAASTYRVICPAPKCGRPMYLRIFVNGSVWICPVHGRSGVERRVSS